MNLRFFPLAAADSRLESVARSLQRHRAESDGGDAVAVLAGLAVAVVLFWLIARWTDRSTKKDSPWRLFLTLAKAHQLGWRDCWLLCRIARSGAASEPALVFLDPRLTTAEEGQPGSSRRAARLKALRARIFAGIEERAHA